MNPWLYLLWATLALPQSGFAQIPQSALPISDHNPPPTTSRIEIPFKLYRDYLIVAQGSLGPLQRLNFLIDTGINPTALDRRIAKKLRLTAEADVHEVALLNQHIQVGQAVLPRLQLGPIWAESLPVVIQDLSPIGELLGLPIDAQIGLDVLSMSSFSIDYRSKKIVFGPIESTPFAVPFDTLPPVLTVQAEVHDMPVRLLLDTGSAELVLFGCQLHGRLRWLPVSGGVKRLFNNTGHQVGLTEMWLPGLRLGPTIFGVQKALATDGDANCDQPFDGLVGITRLGLKWVAFDFEHRRFGWKR